MPLISILIPAHNAQTTIHDAVASVAAQTYDDWELVVVNDGSTDSTPQLLKALAAQDDRIRLITTPNRGVASARNTALDAARGQYIMWLDSDDTLDPRAIELMLPHAAPDVIVQANAPRAYEISGRRAVLNALYQRGADHSLWGKLIPAALFDGLRFTHRRIYEDLEVMPRVMLRAVRFVALNQLLYHYTVRPDSLSHRPDAARHAQALDALDVLRTAFRDDRELLRAVSVRTVDAAFHILRQPRRNRTARRRARQALRSNRLTALLAPRTRLRTRLASLLLWL